MVVIGIDIGLTGALAAVDSRGTCSITDLPTLPTEGKRHVGRRLDPRSLILLVRQFIPPGEAALALFEDVHTGTGPGAAARASLMHSRGIVEAVLEIARIDCRAVQPATWKRFYGLTGKKKVASLHTARSLYPSADAQLKRQKDHNRADALLIAHFGQRTLT
jgi:hypothetical protein